MAREISVLFNGECLLGKRSGVGKFAHQLITSMPQTVNLGIFGVPKEVRGEIGELPYLEKRHGRVINRLRKLNPWYDLKSEFPNFSLYHELNYVPQRFKGKVVTTIYDLSYRRYPQFHPRDRVEHLVQGENSMQNSDAILTISQHAKQEIIEFLKIPEEKIFVVNPGLDSHFKPLPSEDVNQYISSLGLSKDYILSVGNIEPRKNLETLLLAYSILNSKHLDFPPLVIVGAKGWLHSGIFRIVQEKKLVKKIHFMDYVPENVLPILYNGASLLVYPSYYEGFGMPIVEAMACGTPVVTSDTSSMPEAAGGAAELIDPHNIEMLWTRLEALLQNNSRRSELSELGLKRIKDLTWESCAAKVFSIYERIM